MKNYNGNTWYALLYEIITRSKNSECNIVYICKCNCSNKRCPGIMLCYKINYVLMHDCIKKNMDLMKVNDLRNYVVCYDYHLINNDQHVDIH